MLPGERFKNWIEGLSESWKDRLRGWMANWFENGITRFIELIEPDAIENVRGLADKISADPNTPDYIKKMLGKSMEIGHPLPLLIVVPLAVLMVLPMVFSIAAPLGRLFEYQEDKLLHSFRLDPGTITRAWLRNKPGYEWLWQDLRDMGWSETKIEVARELAHIIPPLADMVRFADFGSFDPKIIELWREFYDAPSWITEPMSLLGITGEWANKYWFSHWRQPGRFELGELHRRGEIDDELVKNAYLTQGYSSFWQEKLLELVKTTWTRVDIRRMWDMRTIDEREMRKAYQAVGYYDDWLEGIVLWTKVYVAFPDLMARWTKGWITIDDVRTELTALGMPAERIEEMIQTKIKPEEPERVEEGRALTKTEIYKGVKKDIITWEQGIELLMDLGYDEDEADYILAVNVGALAGSPETFEEFKDWTTKYRIATGREVKPMPEELKAAAAEVIRLTKEVESLQESITEEKRGLLEDEVLPEAATARLTELHVKRNRAISELARVQSEYDRLIAEWKHGK